MYGCSKSRDETWMVMLVGWVVGWLDDGWEKRGH